MDSVLDIKNIPILESTLTDSNLMKEQPNNCQSIEDLRAEEKQVSVEDNEVFETKNISWIKCSDNYLTNFKKLDQILDLKNFPFLGQQLGRQKPFRKNIRLIYIFGAGGQNALFINNKDICYAFGNNRYGCLAMGNDSPYTITIKINSNLSNKQLIDICSGSEHYLGLTFNGKCYSWGNNHKGQLGVDTKRFCYSPLFVKGLVNEKVIQISCGAFYSLALTDEGKVYSWGRNNWGQLGLSHKRDMFNPTLINIKHRIVSISSGWNHCLALAENGVVYTWGNNQFGQLGELKADHIITPKPFPNQFKSYHFKKVICGKSHSFLLTTDGFIYGFGSNYWGQIGNGSTEDQLTPIIINNEIRFSDIITHPQSNLSIGISNDGKYYIWGLANGINILTPKLVSETSKESVFNVYAKFAKKKITLKTIVINNDFNRQLNVCSEQPKVVENSIGLDVKNCCTDMNDKKETIKSPTISSEGLSQHSILCDNHSIHSSIGGSNPLFNLHNSVIKSFNCPKNSDLKFKTEDKTIYCHKTILQIRSEKFWEIISKQMNDSNEIQITTEKYDSFYAFLQYLYGMEPEFNDKIIYDLKQMAEIFDENNLLNECLQYIEVIENTPNLSNVCSLYEKAFKKGLTDLKNSCIEFAKNNWKEVFTSNEFQAMDDSLSK